MLGRHHHPVLSLWPLLALFKGGSFPAGLRDREDLPDLTPEPDDAETVPRPCVLGMELRLVVQSRCFSPWNFLICSRFRK